MTVRTKTSRTVVSSVLQSGAVEQWSTACINKSHLTNFDFLKRVPWLRQYTRSFPPTSNTVTSRCPFSASLRAVKRPETPPATWGCQSGLQPPTCRTDWPPTMMTESACAGLSMWVRGWRCTDCWQTVYSSYCRCTQYSSYSGTSGLAHPYTLTRRNIWKIHNSRFLNVLVEGSNQPPSWLCKFPPSSWPLQRWLYSALIGGNLQPCSFLST